jgi:hypothetical protein
MKNERAKRARSDTGDEADTGATSDKDNFLHLMEMNTSKKMMKANPHSVLTSVSFFPKFSSPCASAHFFLGGLGNSMPYDV